MALLKIENLTVRFGGLEAVSQIDIEVESGDIHALIGPNGAGKTTLFNAVTRVVNPFSGSINLNGNNLLKAKPFEIVDKGISRTFQNLEIYGLLTVKENFLIGHHSKVKTNWLMESFQTKKMKKEENLSEEKAVEVAKFLGIENRLNSRAGMLPYGLQKMVEIGRALMSDPILLLLDEPAAGLNPSETEELKRIVFSIKDKGVTIVLVEHDMSLVMGISDDITVMNFGKKIAQGNPEKIKNNPQVVEAYLGENKYA